jgi:Fe-S-cluster containining protein
MSFSREDLAAFQAEADRTGDALRLSKCYQDINAVTHSFMNRLSIAFEGFRKQHDIHISCRSGCDYCCRYNRVEVFTLEAFAIVDFIHRSFNDRQIEDLKKALVHPSQPARALGHDRKVGGSYYRQCAFLSEGRCSIYEIRPFNCRQFHSIDVHLCEQKFLDPSRQVDDPADIKLRRRLHALIAAYEEAMARAGYKTVRNELNQAVDAMLNDPDVMDEWMKTRTPL